MILKLIKAMRYHIAIVSAHGTNPLEYGTPLFNVEEIINEMDRAGLIDFFEKQTAKMKETMEKKNADYAGATADPFANFTRVETIGICTTEQGFLTRMTDKLCRITSFVKNGELKVKDESVQDTLMDLANYSILMAAFLESKKEKL